MPTGRQTKLLLPAAVCLFCFALEELDICFINLCPCVVLRSIPRMLFVFIIRTNHSQYTAAFPHNVPLFFPKRVRGMMCMCVSQNHGV